MSIHYDFKETIRIADTEKSYEAFCVFVNHLLKLGAEIIDDNARIHKIQIIADNNKKEFSSETITKDYQELVRAVKEAASVEAVLDYDFWQKGGFTIANGKIIWDESADLFDIAEYISKLDDEQRDGLFYSLYNYADCSETSGQLAAYGEKNGKMYNGIVKAETIAILPNGVWYSHPTAIVYDVEDVENIEEVESVCDAMTKFSSYDELSVNGNEISFYLNNLELKNDAELVEFAGLCQKLLKATNSECYGATELNLADLISDDGRIVNIKIDADSGYEIHIQTTDF